MSLFQMLIKGGKRSNGWDSIADELAIQCVGIVHNRLGEHVERMSRNECRGYIRARARMVVKQKVDNAVIQESIPAEHVAKLNYQVLETTSGLVHQQIVNQPFRKPTRRVA